jgi:hypothetical protein
MFRNHTPSLESRNFIDGVDFTRDDPCIFVVYPAGAAGDLLISIIDKHYLRTGCEYYGISDSGRVMIYTTDYEAIDIELEHTGQVTFDQQWFYDLAEKLGQRNLNYSLLDQVMFGCHLHKEEQIKQILDNFSQAKIINIHPKDAAGQDLINELRSIKLETKLDQNQEFSSTVFHHERVLNIPFGCLFDKPSYSMYYHKILEFLKLGQRQLISFDYIDFYLSKQDKSIVLRLTEYSKHL